jgi:hypothetical protein
LDDRGTSFGEDRGTPPARQGHEWRIHTGPFPFIVPLGHGEAWLWRITDGLHFTSSTVVLHDEALRVPRKERTPEVQRAVDTRGRSAVEAALRWAEPPRQITFLSPLQEPEYWGGKLDSV